LRYLQ